VAAKIILSLVPKSLQTSQFFGGQVEAEPQRARRTQRIKEKNLARFASFAVKFSFGTI
jgi:hypothetical protein